MSINKRCVVHFSGYEASMPTRFLSYLIILSFSFLVGANQVLAHGESTVGPHKGVIRMPGAFHTEVVSNSEKSIAVYLLDINFKNPSVKDSTLGVHWRKSAEGETQILTCKSEKDFFTCELPEAGLLNKKGQLVVHATREGAAGAEVTYDLPLKPATGSKKKPGNSEHQHSH